MRATMNGGPGGENRTGNQQEGSRKVNVILRRYVADAIAEVQHIPKGINTGNKDFHLRSLFLLDTAANAGVPERRHSEDVSPASAMSVGGHLKVRGRAVREHLRRPGERPERTSRWDGTGKPGRRYQ